MRRRKKKLKEKKSENHLTVALSNLALALGLEELVVGFCVSICTFVPVTQVKWVQILTP
jgi:hypothetical protein